MILNTKLMVRILTGVMFFSILTGCSGKKLESNAVNTTSVDTNTGNITEEFKSTGGLKLPLSDTPTTLKYLIGERADASVKNDWPTLKEIEKRTNVRIEFEAVPSAGWEEKKKILIATHALPDLASISAIEARKYGPEGVFFNMKKLIASSTPNIKNYLDKYPEAKYLATAPDDGIYAVPGFGREGYSNCWMVRKDLMEELNLKNPTNPDEFYSMLKAFKEKYPKSYPFVPINLTGKGGIYTLFSRIFTEVDGVLGYNAVTQKFAFAPDHPGFKDMLIYLNKLYNEGLMDPEFSLIQLNQWEERLLTDRGFLTWHNQTRPDQFTAKAQSANPQTKYVMYPMPLFAAKGIKVYHTGNSAVNGNVGITISSNSKHPEVAVKYIDYLYSEEGAQFTTFGIEGVTYDKVDGKPVFKDFLGKDPAPALRKDYGVAYDGFWPESSRYVAKRSQNYLDGNAMYNGLILPPYKAIVDTEKENETKKEISTFLDKYIEEQVTRFIMGGIPITDATYSEFVKQCKKYGADTMVQLLNSQYEKAYGKK